MSYRTSYESVHSHTFINKPEIYAACWHAEHRDQNATKVTLWSLAAFVPRPVVAWMLGVNRCELKVRATVQQWFTAADKSCRSTIYVR